MSRVKRVALVLVVIVCWPFLLVPTSVNLSAVEALTVTAALLALGVVYIARSTAH